MCLVQRMIFIFSLFMLNACTEGETTEIYEFFLAADLGIEEISLVKEHSDNLRPGRELRVKAIAMLKSGESLDISEDVRWFSSDPSILSVAGEGVFLAWETKNTTEVPFRIEFAGLVVRSEATVSMASLKALEVGFAKKGISGQCQMASAVFEMSQCTGKKLCVLGEYKGEALLREETSFVDWVIGGDSLVEEGYLVNAKVDMSGGDVNEMIRAKLDGLSSNLLNIIHVADMEDLEINAPSNKIMMGRELIFQADSISPRLQPYIKWRAESFDSGEPDADVSISDGKLRALFEQDFVSDWDAYGVNVTASCSGFSSDAEPVLIESDVDLIKITDESENHDLVIGGDEPVIFTVEAKSKEGTILPISNGDITWFVCSLSDPVCALDDKQGDNGSLLSLLVSEDEEAKDVRIEAVFHGRKASREDFRFVE